MITPKEVTLSLRYKLTKTDNIDTCCTILENILYNVMMSNNFMKTFNIVALENHVTVENTSKNYVDLIISSYITTADKSKLSNKLLKAYIDLNMSTFALQSNTTTATLIKRRIY